MLHPFKSSLVSTALSFVLLSAAQAQQPAQGLSAQERAKIEAELKDARERLEKAAREVGQLSGKLTGPMGYDYFITNQLRQRGAVLGVTINEDPEDTSQNGVTVESVVPQGAAEKAGIKENDVIVSLNGKTLKNAKPSPGRALVTQMETVKPGEKVKVELLRNGKKQTVEVTAQAGGPNVLSTFPQRYAFGQGRADVDSARRARELAELRMKSLPGPRDNNVMVFNQFFGASMMDMELVAVTPKLGRYFGVDSGLLIVKPPRDADVKLEEGDVIVDIDGRKPQDSAHAMRILRSYQPGEQVNFGVMRDRKAIKVPVEVPKGGINPFGGAAPQVRSFNVGPDGAIDVIPTPPAPPQQD